MGDTLKDFLGAERHPVMIWGVCAALAQRLHAETWALRLCSGILLLIFTVPALAGYLALGFLLPESRDLAVRTTGQILRWMEQIGTLVARRFRETSSKSSGERNIP